MKRKFPDLVCAKCGSNRFEFPRAAADPVKCEDCGHAIATLDELQAKIVAAPKPRESRSQRALRHAEEVARSHKDLRASVAETDRLIVASNEMIRRHRKEQDDGGK